MNVATIPKYQIWCVHQMIGNNNKKIINVPKSILFTIFHIVTIRFNILYTILEITSVVVPTSKEGNEIAIYLYLYLHNFTPFLNQHTQINTLILLLHRLIDCFSSIQWRITPETITGDRYGECRRSFSFT